MHAWTYELEVVLIVASALAMTAFGASVLRTGAVSRRTGWLAIGWRIGASIVFALPYQGFPPLVTQFVPLMVGVALLRDAGGANTHCPRSHDRCGSTTAASGRLRNRAPCSDRRWNGALTTAAGRT